MNKVEKIINNLFLSKFIKREELKQGITNSGWLFLDKFIRILFGFFVNIQITRYLGPEQYGTWNYILAFIVLFMPISSLGLESIVVRELISEPGNKNRILGSAFILRITGSIFAMIICSIAFIVQNSGNTVILLYFFINIAVFVFSPFEIIDYFYLSKSKSKYSVFSKTFVFILLNGVKIFFLFAGFTLPWFIAIHVIDISLGLILLVFVYNSRFESIFLWKFDKLLAIKFFKESWILMFSSMITILYMKIDQIMIHEMLNDKELGYYSAALRISEMWYFIPVIITNSLMPALVNSYAFDKNLFQRKMQRLLDTLVWISLIIGTLIGLQSKFIVELLYGPSFVNTALILSIHIWSGIFVFIGVAIASWITIKQHSKINFYKTSIGAIANIGLNLFLIPKYGAIGAAIATCISYFLAAVASNLLFKETFVLMGMVLNTLNVPRIFKEIYNEKYNT